MILFQLTGKDYAAVVKAKSHREAAAIGFDYSDEIGNPQQAIEVNTLREPEGNGRGLCYEVNDTCTFCRVGGRTKRKGGGK